VIHELQSYGVNVLVHDPVPLPEEARHEYGVELVAWDQLPQADAIVAAVAHKEFLKKDTAAFAAKLKHGGGCFVDVKSAFDATALRKSGIGVWRL